MGTVEATFAVPDRIEKGLQSKHYVRFGGVIRDAQTKQVVAMLREASPILSQATKILFQFGSISSILNLGISAMGFALVMNRLKGIENRVIERLNKIEQNFKQNQDALNQFRRNFDIFIYANFGSALDLAHDAFTMKKPENRLSMANLAINRLAEVQCNYMSYLDVALEEDLQLTCEYISSLFLLCVVRARCYLELGETETACFHLQEGTNFLRSRIKKYVKGLLSTTPVAFVSPSWTQAQGLTWGGSHLSSPIDLSRLVKICQWLDSSLDTSLDEKNILLEAQRKNLIKLIAYPTSSTSYSAGVFPVRLGALGLEFGGIVGASVGGTLGAIAGIGAEIAIRKALENSNPTEEDSNPNPEEILQLLEKEIPEVVKKIEDMIETYHRFEAYQLEIQALEKLEINFHDWLQLAPNSELQQNEAELMWLIPSEPLAL
jgi:hypothetical protein